MASVVKHVDGIRYRIGYMVEILFCKGVLIMKTITRHKDNKFILQVKCSYADLYDQIKQSMPLGDGWIVDTGKRKRLYFWFYGNKYQGNLLCWIILPK